MTKSELKKSQTALLKVLDKCGGIGPLSKKLGLSYVAVWGWTREDKVIPPKWVAKVVSLSDGIVTKDELRPDIF